MGGRASKPKPPRRLFTVKLFTSAAFLQDPILGEALAKQIRSFGLDEWWLGDSQWMSVWRSPFAKSQREHPAAILDTMTTDMKHDVILMYQTLFSVCSKSSPVKIPLTPEEATKYNRRVLFLKRLFLCLAVCGLTYCEEENCDVTRAWPFPLAAALCHGSRILIRLDGVSCSEFTNFLLLGDAQANEGDVPSPFFTRWAASHAVGFHEPADQLYEHKLTLTQGLKNLDAGMKSKHLGLDLPVGGFANRAPIDSDKMCIGPAGVPYRTKKVAGSKQVVFANGIQHGHLYLRRDDFGNARGGTEHVSSILLGIENSAPQKESFFCPKHTAAAKKHKTSAFGTRKWKDYRKGGLKVPADTGGMHVRIDTAAFEALQELCESVQLSLPYDGYTTGLAGEALRLEKGLFKELLQSSDEQVAEVLLRRQKFDRAVL